MAEKIDIPVRGRGALIAAALKRAQELKPGGSGDAPTICPAEPPKPRGRAALMEQLTKRMTVPVGQIPSKPPEPPVEKVAEKLAALDVKDTPLEYKGISGTIVPASANYITLNLEPNRGVFEYEVIYSPEVDSKTARVKILNKAIHDICRAKTFDGHLLYLPMQFIETRKHFDTVHPFTDEPVTMTIIFKKRKQMGECIHLYNVLFKRIMHILHFIRVGREFFDNQKPYIIPQHKLEIWPGYVTAINEFSGGIMLCLDVQHRVLRTQNALEFIYEQIHQNKQRYKQCIEKTLIGSSVLTRYNNKSYVVHDISWDCNPHSTFENNAGVTISFLEYYQKQHNVLIQDSEQPLLIHRQTFDNPLKAEKDERFLLLVPELCFMTGLTDEMRNDFRIMKDVAQYTRVTPNQRMDSLRKYVTSINKTPEAKEVLGAWGLTIGAATIDLQMRVLSPEEIYFGGDVKVHGTMQADWTSAALKNHVITSIDIHNWLIIHTGQDKRNMDEFAQCFMRMAPKMGIHVSRPKMHCLADDRNDSYIQILQERIVPELQIVVIICPTSRDDRYSVIKKVCCSRMPIPSQVINSRTLRNSSKLPAITQKIALQMNCKLGGSLWSVRFPFKSWMICGIDVYHSVAKSGQAVCAFVSSTNDSMSRWFSACHFHKQDKEIGDHLHLLFANALREYHIALGHYPTQVVIYRDGVGDGQFGACTNLEIPQLLHVIKELGLPIKLVFIVVQKRINTRIFAFNNRTPENPAPGSIVDTTITRKYLYDFFLVAQMVRQGTVTPTHYIVLHDDSNTKPDNIQRLSYKMCHMYYNWTGTVRVPAPCQYAHKLAYLIGQNVRVEHAPSLSHKLFYL